jgi:hypothetical protein
MGGAIHLARLSPAPLLFEGFVVLNEAEAVDSEAALGRTRGRGGAHA